MNDYRYAFQGQELDRETGMEAFELRLWDGRLGRWLSPDPYGQYASPYLGMGNNPIGMIDPDGGYTNPISAFFAWVGGGFKGSIEHTRGEGNHNYAIFHEGSVINDGYGSTLDTVIPDHWQYGKDKTHMFNPTKIYDPIGWFNDRLSGSIEWGGAMKSGFNGDKIGKNGFLYPTYGPMASPGIDSKTIVKQAMKNFNDGFKTINHGDKIFKARTAVENIDIRMVYVADTVIHDCTTKKTYLTTKKVMIYGTHAKNNFSADTANASIKFHKNYFNYE